MGIFINLLNEIEIILLMWVILQLDFTKNKVKMTLGVIFTVVAVVFSEICSNDDLRMILGVIILPLIGNVLLFEGTLTSVFLKYWFSFCYTDFAHMPSELAFKFFEFVFRVNVSEEFERIICYITTIIILIVLGYFIKRRKEVAEWIKDIPRIYFVLGIICAVVVSGIEAFARNISHNESAEAKVLLEVLIIVVSIFVYLLGIGFSFADLLRREYKKRNDLNIQYLNMSKEYYNQQVVHMQEIRSIKHDMNAHMNILGTYAERQEWGKLKEYLQQIVKHQEISQGKIIDVGNEIINAIMADAMRKSKISEDNVVIECVGVLPNDIDISEYDLCTIFFNLVSNGVEACNRLKKNEKRLRIVFKEEEGLARILFENPIEWEVDINKLGTYTSKKEKEQHGYGISNVQKTVSRCGGSMVMKAVDGKFRVVILINKSDNG